MVETAAPLSGARVITSPSVHVADARGRRVRAAVAMIAPAVLGIVVIVSLLAPVLPLVPPAQQDLPSALQGMSGAHWLGTDQYGRDLLSRLIWGTRTSALAALTAAGVAGAVGVPLGLVAGYRKGWLDWLLGRLSDTVLTVPALVMLITLQAALQTSIWGEMVVLGLLFAPRVQRVVRTASAVVCSAPYVVAARLSGCRHRRVLLRYVMPNVKEQIVVQLSYLLGLAFVIETGISFLDIGVQAPDSSLGTLLAGGSPMMSVEPRLILVPAVVLTIVILCCNTVGDLLNREAADA